MGTNVGAVVEPPPHPNNPAPSPFHCLPVNPGYFGRTSWLSWFSRKKSRGRTGQETTLKQPRKLIFQSWNQIFGQVTRQWAWPTGTTQKESTSSAIYCKITISFGEIFIFTSSVLGVFFLQFFKLGFLTFHNGIVRQKGLLRLILQIYIFWISNVRDLK